MKASLRKQREERKKMEKFAVDLDAVLDEFEYHEGQVHGLTIKICTKLFHPTSRQTSSFSFAGLTPGRHHVSFCHWFLLPNQ